MSDHFSIRPMTTSDLANVLEIQSACYTQVEPESEESLRAKLTASPATCFVASLENKVIAYLISLPWQFQSPPALNAATCELKNDPDCLYLHDVAVAPVARGSGVAARLVERFLSCLHALNLGRASLIAVQNSASYWRKFGFESVTPTDLLRAKLATYGNGVEYMQRMA